MAIEVLVPGVPEPILVEIGGLVGPPGPAGANGAAGADGPPGPAPAGSGCVVVDSGEAFTVPFGTQGGNVLRVGPGDTLYLDSRAADGYGLVVQSASEACAVFESIGGPAFNGTSVNGSGILATSQSGTYHAQFGTSDNNRSAIERVRGWLVWFFGAFTGRLKTADLTATREWTLPDVSGTVALTSDLSGLAAAGHTHVSTEITDATALSTAGKIVKRDISGNARFRRVIADEGADSYMAMQQNRLVYNPGDGPYSPVELLFPTTSVDGVAINLPDVSGTVGILLPFADSTTADATVSVGDAWWDNTLKKVRVRLS